MTQKRNNFFSSVHILVHARGKFCLVFTRLLYATSVYWSDYEKISRALSRRPGFGGIASIGGADDGVQGMCPSGV